MTARVRPAAGDDLAALTRIDSSYPSGRYLALERSDEAPELTLALRWRNREPGTVRAYPEYDLDWYRRAQSSAGLFLVAEVGRRIAGYLIALVPTWTDAVEITDLAVDASKRRRGAGRALVEAATDWARGRRYRALWVEPRSDNAVAVCFYASLGFRLAGFNDRMYSNRDQEPGMTTLYMYLELR